MIFYDPQQFLEKLLEVQNKDNYLFRGITEARFPSEPRAFREKHLKEHAEQFSHPETTVQQWFSKAINNIKRSPNKDLASISIFSLNHICRLLIQILQYNHAIYTMYNSLNYPKNCNDEKLINIFEFGSNGHWAKEKTFNDFFERFLLALIPFSTDGSLSKESYVHETITGLDQSYPQHYGMPTSALDWTYNPLKALFFTWYSDDSSDDSKYLSVAIYRQKESKDSPIIIKDRDALKDNPRAVAQEGTFTYFREPCSFYLREGKFPTIENYRARSEKFFSLEKFVLLRTKKNIEFIKKICEENGINEESLRLL